MQLKLFIWIYFKTRRISFKFSKLATFKSLKRIISVKLAEITVFLPSLYFFIATYLCLLKESAIFLLLYLKWNFCTILMFFLLFTLMKDSFHLISIMTKVLPCIPKIHFLFFCSVFYLPLNFFEKLSV